MEKRTSKISYLFISLFSLIVLSGCSVVDKSGEIRQIDGGFWDAVFVKPVAFVMNFITEYTGYYAIGVILTTIIVRTIAFPIYTKTNESSTKMQAIQPEVQKLQARYAGKTDPESKQKMQMEMMKLYKDNDVNMLAGCLMPFLQMPIFMAMYHAVARTPITYGFSDNNETMSFFWTMLNNQESIWSNPVNVILPIIVAITAVLQQKVSMMGMSEEAKNNPTMKVMTYMMPVMMFVFSISQVQALSLYWVAGNIYSTLQVIVVKKPFSKKEDTNITNKKVVKKY
jgi:YidC/Oxa1 family membrane protein insertase